METTITGQNTAHRSISGLPIVVVLGITALCTFILYRFITPALVQSFTLAQLRPVGEILVEYQGVYASPAPDGVSRRGSEVQRSYINGEVVFDFTGFERSIEKHGYIKRPVEWMIKSPTIGESAIYLRHEVFFLPSLLIGAVFALMISLAIPSSFGWMALLTERTIKQTRSMLLLETGLDSESLDVLTMPDIQLQRLAEKNLETEKGLRAQMQNIWTAMSSARQQGGSSPLPAFGVIPNGYLLQARSLLVEKIREVFPQSLHHALVQLQSATQWQYHRLRLFSAFRIFMSQFFVPRYANRINGLAYAGAALLIIAIGLRGLKFIPPTHPGLILSAIVLESVLLLALGVSLYYQHAAAGEEKSALSLQHIQQDINSLAVMVRHSHTDAVEQAVQAVVNSYVSSNTLDKHVSQALSDRIIAALRGSQTP